MPRLMLDTNICIHAIKRNEPEIVRRLERTRPQDVAISGVVAAELWMGVMKSRERQRNERALNEFLAFVEVLDWPSMRARCWQREIATSLRESKVCELKVGTEINGRKIADGNGSPSYTSEELYSQGGALEPRWSV